MDKGRRTETLPDPDVPDDEAVLRGDERDGQVAPALRTAWQLREQPGRGVELVAVRTSVRFSNTQTSSPSVANASRNSVRQAGPCWARGAEAADVPRRYTPRRTARWMPALPRWTTSRNPPSMIGAAAFGPGGLAGGGARGSSTGGDHGRSRLAAVAERLQEVAARGHVTADRGLEPAVIAVLVGLLLLRRAEDILRALRQAQVLGAATCRQGIAPRILHDAPALLLHQRRWNTLDLIDGSHGPVVPAVLRVLMDCGPRIGPRPGR